MEERALKLTSMVVCIKGNIRTKVNILIDRFELGTRFGTEAKSDLDMAYRFPFWGWGGVGDVVNE